MSKLIATLLLAVSAVMAQYKAEPAGEPPPELTPAIAGLLERTGHKILSPDGKVYCELWFVAKAPSGPKTAESDVSWPTVPFGSVIGAIRWPGQGSDRRGQGIKAGVYTLRFGLFPINGDHQGVAPQRDFLVMSMAAEDKDAAVIDNFDALINLSRKVSGTPHPAVLSMWKVEGDAQPGMTQSGESDWALKTRMGDVTIAVILVGKVEG